MSDATDRRSTSRSTAEVAGELNRMLSGWANYFSLGTVSGVYNLVDRHVGYRLRMWLNSKHKVHCVGRKRFIDEATARKLGLDRLSWRKGSLPWA